MQNQLSGDNAEPDALTVTSPSPTHQLSPPVCDSPASTATALTEEWDETLETYALNEVVRTAPQKLLSAIFEYQGICLDPHHVEITANNIVSHLEQIGVPRTFAPLDLDSSRSSAQCQTYSCFLCYRVSSDRCVAELLFEKLRRVGYTPFLDAHCLPRAERWSKNIRRALARSRVFLPLISAAGLAQVKEVDRDHSKDNVLLEYQIALGLMDMDRSDTTPPFHVLPVLVGTRLDNHTLVEFSEYHGYATTINASLT